MPDIRSVVIYSPYDWEHALVTLRITGPLRKAGVECIHGNHGMDIHPERVMQADAVLLQREFVDNLEFYDQILSLARTARKPVIYEIDDQLFELPDYHIDYPSHYYSPALFSMLRAVIEADLVTTTTPPLRDYLSQFNPHIAVLPNYLDEQLWLLKEPSQEPQNSDHPNEIVIGYMGSNTHQPDLDMITPVLVRLLERYDNQLRLRFWSAEPPEVLRQHPKVEWTPLSIYSYAEFAKFFTTQTCDIFIAPLIDSEFNRCKSGIKYLEYSALGIPGVYSRTTPYESIVRDGQNGFLADSDEEWEQRLIGLIESAELRAKIGQQALDTVRHDWLLSQHTQEWTQAYQRAWQVAQQAIENQTRQKYVNIFVKLANQVRGWQNKIYDQVIERDYKIQGLEVEIVELQQLLTKLQDETVAKEGLIQKLAKRVDRKLLQAARNVKRRISS